MYLRRQIAQDSISASKNLGGVFFCRIWQLMQITMLITFAGLTSSQPYSNFVRERVKLLDSYNGCCLDISQIKTFSAVCVSDHI